MQEYEGKMTREMCLVLSSVCEGQGRVVFFVGHWDGATTCFSGADPSASVACGRQRQRNGVRGDRDKRSEGGDVFIDVETVSVGLCGMRLRSPRLVVDGCRGCCQKGQHSNQGAQCKHSSYMPCGWPNSELDWAFEFTSIFSNLRQFYMKGKLQK
jgi:hypothetical protein